jgi:hypothetical protein
MFLIFFIGRIEIQVWRFVGRISLSEASRAWKAIFRYHVSLILTSNLLAACQANAGKMNELKLARQLFFAKISRATQSTTNLFYGTHLQQHHRNRRTHAAG